MADLEISAGYCETGDEDGAPYAAFGVSDEAEDGYLLLRRDGGGTWLEVSDEIFGARDAVAAAKVEPDRFALTITPEAISRLGMIGSVEVIRARDCIGWDEAVATLRRLLPGI